MATLTHEIGKGMSRLIRDLAGNHEALVELAKRAEKLCPDRGVLASAPPGVHNTQLVLLALADQLWEHCDR